MTGISVPDIDGEGASQRHFSFGPGRLSFKPEGSDEWQDLEGCEGFTISIEPEPDGDAREAETHRGFVSIPLTFHSVEFPRWLCLLAKPTKWHELRLRLRRKGRPGWKRAHWRQLLWPH